MKRFMNSFVAIVGIVLMTALSCTKEPADSTDLKNEKHTCTMRLVGSFVDYDALNTKAETNTTSWADGSTIYLRMSSPLGWTTGEAIYNAAKDVWTISYYGSLYEGASNTCTAIYLEDKVSYENSLFTLDEGTVIYEDLTGSYIFEGGDLVVTANLKPRTGRIRFAGTEGTVLKVYGITHYDTYDIGTDIYTNTTEPFKLTVGADGYTPYFYGYFTNTDEPNIKVWIDAKEAYTKFCTKDIFQAGQSGKLTIPSTESHNGWIDGLHFNIHGARFKMVAVEGGTFVMGDPSSTSSYYTAHNVTLTGFCIGETEITNLLYDRINNPESNTTKPNYPRFGLEYSAMKYLCVRLNKIEEFGFTFPTEAQWEFAAKGGIKSKGYLYSGSDNIDEVAWHSENANSTTHEVKTKIPNELGIYDMSGNLYEWVRDNYSTYPSSSQTDPIFIYTGTGTIHYVLRGGCYVDGSIPCKLISRQDEYNYHTTSSSYIGGRLTLDWN